MPGPLGRIVRAVVDRGHDRVEARRERLNAHSELNPCAQSQCDSGNFGRADAGNLAAKAMAGVVSAATSTTAASRQLAVEATEVQSDGTVTARVPVTYQVGNSVTVSTVENGRVLGPVAISWPTANTADRGPRFDVAHERNADGKNYLIITVKPGQDSLTASLCGQEIRIDAKAERLKATPSVSVQQGSTVTVASTTPPPGLVLTPPPLSTTSSGSAGWITGVPPVTASPNRATMDGEVERRNRSETTGTHLEKAEPTSQFDTTIDSETGGLRNPVLGKTQSDEYLVLRKDGVLRIGAPYDSNVLEAQVKSVYDELSKSGLGVFNRFTKLSDSLADKIDASHAQIRSDGTVVLSSTAEGQGELTALVPQVAKSGTAVTWVEKQVRLEGGKLVKAGDAASPVSTGPTPATAAPSTEPAKAALTGDLLSLAGALKTNLLHDTLSLDFLENLARLRKLSPEDRQRLNEGFSQGQNPLGGSAPGSETLTAVVNKKSSQSPVATLVAQAIEGFDANKLVAFFSAQIKAGRVDAIAEGLNGLDRGQIDAVKTAYQQKTNKILADDVRGTFYMVDECRVLDQLGELYATEVANNLLANPSYADELLAAVSLETAKKANERFQALPESSKRTFLEYTRASNWSNPEKIAPLVDRRPEVQKAAELYKLLNGPGGNDIDAVKNVFPKDPIERNAMIKAFEQHFAYRWNVTSLKSVLEREFATYSTSEREKIIEAGTTESD
jgi:hypothetical protein